MGGLRPGTIQVAAAAAALLLAGLPRSVLARHRPDEVMVRFRAGAPAAAADAAARDAGGGLRGEIPRWRIRLVKLPLGRSLEQALERLRRNPHVELAEPNAVWRPVGLPDDPFRPQQWGLARIGATLAWGLTVVGAEGSAAVPIAIIDDGIDSTHEDLSGKILAGFNALCATCTTEPDPGDDHGTFVASVAAAATNDGKGMAGVAWRAPLVPVRVSDAVFSATDWATTEYLVLAGLAWCVDRGIRVVNMSLGSCWDDGFGTVTCDPGSQIGAAAIRDARARGTLVIAAAGNESTTMASMPAAYPYVLGVAATDPNDRPTVFSNRGINVDVAAPGGSTAFIGCASANDIIGCTNRTTTFPGDPYGACAGMGFCPPNCHKTSVGTSFAAPHVAGMAAVLWGRDPALSAAQVAGLIRSTANPLPPATGRTAEAGWGRINLYRALTLTPPPPAPGARLVPLVPPVAPPADGSSSSCPPVGGTFAVSLQVSNTGTAPAGELMPAVVVGGATDSLALEAAPAWSSTELIPPGGSRTWAWTFRRIAPGEATVLTRLEGMDLLTGAAVRAEWTQAVCTAVPLAGSDRPYAAPNPVAGDAFRLVVPLAADAALVRVEAWNAGLHRVWHGEWKDRRAGTAVLEVTGVAGWAPGRYLLRATAVAADGAERRLDPVKVVVKR